MRKHLTLTNRVVIMYINSNNLTVKRRVRITEMHREPRQLRRGQESHPENGLRVIGLRTPYGLSKPRPHTLQCRSITRLLVVLRTD